MAHKETIKSNRKQNNDENFILSIFLALVPYKFIAMLTEPLFHDKRNSEINWMDFVFNLPCTAALHIYPSILKNVLHVKNSNVSFAIRRK